MRRIYKYELQLNDKQVIQMPKYAKVLSAQLQNNSICVWAMIDTEAEYVDKIFYLIGTGWDITNEQLGDVDYIDTLQIGTLVWHVFIDNKQ